MCLSKPCTPHNFFLSLGKYLHILIFLSCYSHLLVENHSPYLPCNTNDSALKTLWSLNTMIKLRPPLSLFMTPPLLKISYHLIFLIWLSSTYTVKFYQFFSSRGSFLNFRLSYMSIVGGSSTWPLSVSPGCPGLYSIICLHRHLWTLGAVTIVHIPIHSS